MKTIKNCILEINQNKKLGLFMLLILVFSQFVLQYKEALWPKMYIVFAILAAVSILTFSRLNHFDKLPRNAFVLIAIIGILNALVLPIRQNLDENTHYYYASQLADGKIRNQVTELNFLEVSPDFLAITQLPSKPEYNSDENTNLYTESFMTIENRPTNYKEELLSIGGFINPAYIPSAVGIVVGRIISNKLFVSYYMGRIFNVIFYALLAYSALKISKGYKIQLFVLSALPYTVWLSAGYNYDSLYYGLVLLLLAQFTNFVKGDTIDARNMIRYCLICLGLILCKAPTILLVFLPLFFENAFFAEKKGRFKYFLLAIITMVLGLIWMLQNTIFGLISRFVFQEVPSAADPLVSNNSRLLYFIGHPIETIELFLRSLSDVIATIINSIQSPQPYLMAANTQGAINLVVFIALMIIISSIHDLNLSKKLQTIVVITFGVITFGIIYAISGDERVFSVGDLHVGGVQGRYHYYILAFLPLLLGPTLRRFYKRMNVNLSESNIDYVSSLVMKLVICVTFFNSCVALYGYL